MLLYPGGALYNCLAGIMPAAEVNELSLTAGKRLLSIAILAIAFYQMPLNALMPVINTVVSVFTDRTLAEVQTAFAFANFVMPVVSLLGAFLINRGVITKKTAVWAGLTCPTLRRQRRHNARELLAAVFRERRHGNRDGAFRAERFRAAVR